MLTPNENRYSLWIRDDLDDHGDIVSGSCGCSAGGKPHGSCKHIATLWYALEVYYRLLEEIRLQDSCISCLQVWNRPRKRRLPPQEVEEISFIRGVREIKAPSTTNGLWSSTSWASVYNCSWKWSFKGYTVCNRKKCCISARPAPSNPIASNSGKRFNYHHIGTP